MGAGRRSKAAGEKEKCCQRPLVSSRVLPQMLAQPMTDCNTNGPNMEGCWGLGGLGESFLIRKNKLGVISFLGPKTTVLSILSKVTRRFLEASRAYCRIVEGIKIMKRCLLAFSMLALLVSTGCHLRRDCNQCGVGIGCRPCTIGWQRGGTDYQSHISHSRYPHHAQAQQGGPQAATVGYPYYTTRGPRDFLVDNPPTIGR